jgi:hypothetical protein
VAFALFAAPVRLDLAMSTLADIVVLLHFGFILFVLFGGLLVLRWRRLMWIHVPVFIWGVFIEWVGWVCPLTPLEQRLRAAAGAAAYEGGFIDHYIMPLVYPPGLTREMQWVLGGVVLALNATVYGIIFLRRRRRPAR